MLPRFLTHRSDLPLLPGHLLLKGMAGTQESGVIKMASGQHQADRQTIDLPAGNSQ